MADYPDLAQVTGTIRRSTSGINILRAVSGRPIFSNYTYGNWHVFTVLHEGTETDVDTILSHYAANRMTEFNFTFDPNDRVYTVQYADHPRVTPLDGEDHFQIESTLVWTARPINTGNTFILLSCVSSLTVSTERTNKSIAVQVTSTGSITASITSVHKPTVSAPVGAAISITRSVGKNSSAASVSCTSSVSSTGVKN